MNDVYLPIIGQGSQPKEEDGADLDFMRLPSAMATYTMPQVSVKLEPEAIVRVKAVLQEAQSALSHFDPNEENSFNVRQLTEQEQAFLNEILGEGEVSIIQNDDLNTQIQESVLAGLWRVRCFEKDTQKLCYDSIEVADIPHIIKNYTFENAIKQLQFDNENLPTGLMNALPLIAEINAKIADFKQDSQAHVINLSLLPQTPEDLAFLYETLGKGTTSILSRGYGTNRITSTMTDKVWWVQYFNSDDTLILNTLEVSEVPSVACAAMEDLADSATRLAEILAIY
jgi:hydrogenase-1 operon protein HyaF